MAKTKAPPTIKESAQRMIDQLWDKCENKFLDALDDSKQRTIQVNFAVTLNLKEAAPVVDVKISFKDKAKEGGMDVSKTLSTATAEQLDDPSQPMLPGTPPAEYEEGKGSKKGKKKKGDDDTAGDVPN